MSKMIFRGNAVSQGIGIGGIFVCKSPEISVNTENIEKENIEIEITNLEVAVCKTYIEIYDLYDGFSDLLSEEEKRILDVYNAILDDVYFFEELKDLVKSDLITAENAIDKCMKKYIAEIEAGDNEYAKQRTADFNDIRTRLIRNVFVCNDIVNLDSINNNHIVIVRELNPTLAVTLGKKKVQAVIAQEGAGYLSHAAIILRSSGIPTMNAIDYKSIKGYNGCLAVVDGFEGLVLIEPDDPEIERYREVFKIDTLRKQEAPDEGKKPLITLDKYKIGLSVNISDINDYKAIKGKNVDGIGLVRTETIFMNHRRMPSERRQTIVYSSIIKGISPRPVIIRTIDIGGDKIPDHLLSIRDRKVQNNRGIRWSLSHLDDFKIQLTSLLKASAKGNLCISFPMVENVGEVLKCKELLAEISRDLLDKGFNVKKVKIGAVVETKACVEELDSILPEVDFISIGTNDLLNQIMGLNRRILSSEIREYFDPLFLKTLETIISKAKQAKVPISVCGEMASDPLATVVLIGLGAEDLSVAPSGINIIKRTVRDLYYEVARELVERILECNDINEVMLILTGFIDCRF